MTNPDPTTLYTARSVTAFIEQLRGGEVKHWRAGLEEPDDEPDLKAVPVTIGFVVDIREIREGKVF